MIYARVYKRYKFENFIHQICKREPIRHTRNFTNDIHPLSQINVQISKLANTADIHTQGKRKLWYSYRDLIRESGRREREKFKL